MSSLVLELQRAALDPNRSVSDLLRHALVVARKLGVADFEVWVNAELNGYPADMEPPGYRELHGTLKAWNPYHGWIPFQLTPPELVERMTTIRAGEAVGTYESLLLNNGDGTLHVDFPPRVEAELMKSMAVPLRPSVIFGRQQLQSVLNAVKNMVLDWSLRLEAAGVLGENMTFSSEEKAKGHQETATYQIQNQTVIHGMSQSQIQQGTTTSTQTFEQRTLDMEAVGRLVREIRNALPSIPLAAAERAEVSADLDTLEAQGKSPKPRRTIVGESLQSLRTILEGAAGGAAGNALPAIIEQLRALL